MAYCRWGLDSDVYVYRSTVMYNGWPKINWIIHSSDIEEIFICKSLQKTINRLKNLENKGHKVPSYAFDRLTKELNNDSKRRS